MTEKKKPAAKKSSDQPLRPRTPNPVKVQKGGSSDSFSHSQDSSKPSKRAVQRPVKKTPPKPTKKSD